jgi:DNA-binding NarL/FixJ family response regulator
MKEGQLSSLGCCSKRMFMGMISIAIAEDNRRICDMLRNKIELYQEFKVAMVAENGSELLKQLHKNHHVDVIIMDVNMPVMDGIEATRQVSQRWPNIKVIICSVLDDEENIFDAILAGACGYLVKDEKHEAIRAAIMEAIEGGAPMSPAIARKALALIRNNKPRNASPEDFGLTKREVEILEHLSKGLSYDQIADNLFISSGTVRKHIENIYRKLQVNNKVEAVQKATQRGIV